MTAQHAPHTPPLWRKVLSLPHTRLGWWALGLAGPALVITGFSWLSDVFEYPILILAWILSALAGGVVGSLALGAAERSLLVWVAQVPTALFFFILPNVFREGSPWGRGSVGVLVWALIALGIIYLMRSAQRNNVRWFE